MGKRHRSLKRPFLVNKIHTSAKQLADRGVDLNDPQSACLTYGGVVHSINSFLSLLPNIGFYTMATMRHVIDNLVLSADCEKTEWRDEIVYTAGLIGLSRDGVFKIAITMFPCPGGENCRQFWGHIHDRSYLLPAKDWHFLEELYPRQLRQLQIAVNHPPNLHSLQ